MVPFENSTNGQVVFTYDFLRDYLVLEPGNASIKVMGEQFVYIHHCLLSRATDIGAITTIYSHPQVWGQVTSWMAEHAGPAVVKIDASSTSKAAEICAAAPASEQHTVAAIASANAAAHFGLPILARNIENNANNTTRFLVLGKESIPRHLNSDQTAPGDKHVTIMVFKVVHDDSGALVASLNVLARYGINMASITSRPSLDSPWHNYFFVEFWGDASSDPNIQAALAEFQHTTLECTVLGSFPRNKRYYGEGSD